MIKNESSPIMRSFPISEQQSKHGHHHDYDNDDPLVMSYPVPASNNGLPPRMNKRSTPQHQSLDFANLHPHQPQQQQQMQHQQQFQQIPTYVPLRNSNTFSNETAMSLNTLPSSADLIKSIKQFSKLNLNSTAVFYADQLFSKTQQKHAMVKTLTLDEFYLQLNEFIYHAFLFANCYYKSRQYKRCLLVLKSQSLHMLNEFHVKMMEVQQSSSIVQQQQQQQQSQDSSSSSAADNNNNISQQPSNNIHYYNFVTIKHLLKCLLLSMQCHYKLKKYDECLSIMGSTDDEVEHNLALLNTHYNLQLKSHLHNPSNRSYHDFFNNDKSRNKLLSKNSHSSTLHNSNHSSEIQQQSSEHAHSGDVSSKTPIDIVSYICYYRGRIYEIQSNQSRSIYWHIQALYKDVRCIESFNFLMEHNLVTHQEAEQLIFQQFKFTSQTTWLKHYYVNQMIALKQKEATTSGTDSNNNMISQQYNNQYQRSHHSAGHYNRGGHSESFTNSTATPETSYSQQSLQSITNHLSKLTTNSLSNINTNTDLDDVKTPRTIAFNILRKNSDPKSRPKESIFLSKTKTQNPHHNLINNSSATSSHHKHSSSLASLSWSEKSSGSNNRDKTDKIVKPIRIHVESSDQLAVSSLVRSQMSPETSTSYGSQHGRNSDSPSSHVSSKSKSSRHGTSSAGGNKTRTKSMLDDTPLHKSKKKGTKLCKVSGCEETRISSKEKYCKIHSDSNSNVHTNPNARKQVQQQQMQALQNDLFNNHNVSSLSTAAGQKTIRTTPKSSIATTASHSLFMNSQDADNNSVSSNFESTTVMKPSKIPKRSIFAQI